MLGFNGHSLPLLHPKLSQHLLLGNPSIIHWTQFIHMIYLLFTLDPCFYTLQLLIQTWLLLRHGKWKGLHLTWHLFEPAVPPSKCRIPSYDWAYTWWWISRYNGGVKIGEWLTQFRLRLPSISWDLSIGAESSVGLFPSLVLLILILLDHHLGKLHSLLRPLCDLLNLVKLWWSIWLLHWLLFLRAICLYSLMGCLWTLH